MSIKFDANEHAHKHEEKTFEAKTLKDSQRILALFNELVSCADLSHNRVYNCMSVGVDPRTIDRIDKMSQDDKAHCIESISICAGCIRTAADKFREAAEHCDALIALCTGTE